MNPLVTAASPALSNPSHANGFTRAPARKIFTAALLAGLATAALNLTVFAIARWLGVAFEGQFQPGAPTTVLPFPLVVISSVLPALVAAAVYLLLRSFFSAATTIFVGLAAVFTMVSFAAPFGIEGASFATKLALNVMHLVAAVVITASIVRASRVRKSNA